MSLAMMGFGSQALLAPVRELEMLVRRPLAATAMDALVINRGLSVAEARRELGSRVGMQTES